MLFLLALSTTAIVHRNLSIVGSHIGVDIEKESCYPMGGIMVKERQHGLGGYKSSISSCYTND